MELKGTIELMSDIQMALEGTKLTYPIDLPRIAVIGAQSTGKSSVLEAIVGEDFLPRGRDIVTTCPLVLSLVHSNIEQKIAKFEGSNEEFSDFEKVHDEIVRQMQVNSGKEKLIVDTPIYLKVEGKDVPDLTLIDLPGFTCIDTDNQSKNTSKSIENLVTNYISHENTIILSISPANDDIANSAGLKYAEMFDPKRERTIGVLTKVDLMDKGVDASSLITDNKHKLKHGYVLVKCKSQQDNNQKKSVKEALQEEKEFFDSIPAYQELPEEQGINALCIKLNKLLTEHIHRLLPDLHAKIMDNMKFSKAKLEELGEELNIETNSERKKAAIKMIKRYCKKYNYAVEHGIQGEDTGKEPTGGIAIHKIFMNFISSELNELDPTATLTDDTILNEIRKCYGLNPGLFVPEEVCRMLIKEQINLLEDPILKCAKRVYDVTSNCIGKCMTRDFDQRKALKSFIARRMQSLLNESYEQLKKDLLTKLKCERSYINYMEDDFTKLKSFLLRDKKIEPDTLRFLQSQYGIDPDVFISPHALEVDDEGNEGELDSSELNEKVSHPLAGVFLSEELDAEKEEVSNIWTIKKVVHCYFCCIKKHFKAVIPKSIVYFLIESFKDDIEESLISDIVDQENLIELVSENKEVSKLRLVTKNNIEKLDMAMEAICEIKNNQNNYCDE